MTTSEAENPTDWSYSERPQASYMSGIAYSYHAILLER
jgi:hypothetical protein